ncbi:MAG: hypothetical protein ACOYL6_19055 [Bacteriovoracaceae bacterium]
MNTKQLGIRIMLLSLGLTQIPMAHADTYETFKECIIKQGHELRAVRSVLDKTERLFRQRYQKASESYSKSNGFQQYATKFESDVLAEDKNDYTQMVVYAELSAEYLESITELMDVERKLAMFKFSFRADESIALDGIKQVEDAYKNFQEYAKGKNMYNKNIRSCTKEAEAHIKAIK